MDKEYIKEKFLTINHLLSNNEYRDLESLRSILDDIIQINYQIMVNYLEKAKNNKEISIFPKLIENQKKIYIGLLKNKFKKQLNERELKNIEILIELRSVKVLREKFTTYNNVKEFFNLIQKLYSLLF